MLAKMSFSPNSELLRRTIDTNYADKKRASSLKWISVNAVVFIMFSLDLWGKCEGYTSPLHYVELCLASAAAANLLHHALRLARRPSASHPRQLFSKDTSTLDSSLGSTLSSEADNSIAEALSLSLGGAWRASPSPPQPSPPQSLSPQHSPHSPHSPSSPLARYDRDEFIADRRSLIDYIRHCSDRGQTDGAWSIGPAAAMPGSAPLYQLATLETESGSGEEGGSLGAAPQVWRRLQLDPQRLTQFNLNLRLWIHVTILERVVREMDALNDALAAHGLADVRIGQVSTERLRKMAASGFPALGALLPFLEPFPDQRYVAQRYRDLGHGGCLSEYKWNGGGSEWDESRPSDAELVLHAFATYLDAQLPGDGGGAGGAGGAGGQCGAAGGAGGQCGAAGGAGAFSARHVSSAPASPPRGPRALVIHRVTRTPPHYVLVRGDETVEVGSGRSNLLHCLLVLIAECAAREPPALQRLHLGRAGLNMLWIVGR